MDIVSLAMAKPVVIDFKDFTFIGADLKTETTFNEKFIELFNLSVQNATFYHEGGYDKDGALRSAMSTEKQIVLKIGANMGYGDTFTYIPVTHTIRQSDGKIADLSGWAILAIPQLNAIFEVKCYITFDISSDSSQVIMNVIATALT